jgi:hypothetical protein
MTTQNKKFAGPAIASNGPKSRRLRQTAAIAAAQTGARIITAADGRSIFRRRASSHS